MKLIENALSFLPLCEHPGAETSLHCEDEAYEEDISGFGNSAFVSK